MKKTAKMTICLVLAAMLAFSCVSCAVGIKAKELSEGYKRTADEVGAVDTEFIRSVAGFSMKLSAGCFGERGKNSLVSPLSAILCLGMIANGTNGETRAQIEKALGCDTDTLSKNLFALTESLYSSDKCRVQTANSLWIKNDGSISVKDSFLQSNADWYGSQVYKAPFDNTTVNDINSWCKKQTDGMIDSIIREIPADTLMYLVNALMFDAEWAEKYEKTDIREHSFTGYSGKTGSVQMLFSTESTYLTGDGVTGFAKDYHGGKYSFVGLLPDEGTDVYELAASLDGEKWLSLWNSQYEEREPSVSVRAGIPEFSFDDSIKLNDVLIGMGMSNMFDAGLADFSRLGSAGNGNLYCGSVQQKAFIKVDRNGTKAAAITWGDMKTGSAEPPQIVDIFLDRPFIYAIVDNATGIPLFVGITAEI